MKFLVICLMALTLACGGTSSQEEPAAATKSAAAPVENPIVVMFMVDGIDLNTVNTAVAEGAKTTASLLEQGVTVEHFLCTSPAARLELPDGSRPWGGSTSSNVALHTGCHVFESRNMDDIFLNARRAGIVSVFAGGSPNYAIFDSVDYLYPNVSDEEVIERGLQHFSNDGARLLRLHLQHIRDAWSGPSDTTNPQSAYVQYYVNTVDPLLAKLVDALKAAGVWERTYVILGSDHGMGQTSASGHPQSVLSSWVTFAAFYGPGVKRGATIPYAEGPDIAIMTNYFLGLPPLQGHLDESVPAAIRKPTGTFLANILEGGPAEIEHPRLIQRFLDAGLPGDDYREYRERMLKLIAP
jgi:Type I phosphodiesterase / nucleotide pyrophosphatase